MKLRKPINPGVFLALCLVFFPGSVHAQSMAFKVIECQSHHTLGGTAIRHIIDEFTIDYNEIYRTESHQKTFIFYDAEGLFGLRVHAEIPNRVVSARNFVRARLFARDSGQDVRAIDVAVERDSESLFSAGLCDAQDVGTYILTLEFRP